MRTEAQKRAEKTYREKLDAIMIRIPKEEGKIIRDKAKAEGKSLTQYIMDHLK